MNKSIPRSAVYLALLTGAFFLLDLMIDRLIGGSPALDLPHILLAVMAIAISFIVLSRAVETRQHAESVLRLARDEMEQRVLERTTELNRANAALQLANNRLRTVIDTLPAGMTIIDTEGNIVLANQLARTMMGRPATRRSSSIQEEGFLCNIDGAPIFPEDLPLSRALQQGEVTKGLEAVSCNKNGEKLYILMAASPVRDEAGDIINAVEVVQDITHLKEMEQALRESEVRYRTQFDEFPEPVTVWDRNGVLLMQNLVSARNLGGQREDYLGKTIYDIFGESAVDYMERMVRAMDSGITEYMTDVVELSFGTQYFWTCMQPVRTIDGQDAVQIISYDITDRQNAEDALRGSEEKFGTIFRYSPDANALVRASDLTFIDVNEAFVQMMGFTRIDVLGKSWTAIDLSADASDVLQIYDLYRDKGKVVNHEIALITGKSNKITILLSLIPIAVGGEACILAIAHDISERKRSEEALRQVNLELAHGIQERIALQERQRLARELHDSVSQALYGISLGTHTALTLFDTDRDRVLEALNYVLSLAQAGLTEMRALIFELRPESLQMEGLVVALTKQTAALQARQGIEVETSLCEEPDVPLAVKEALYRIAQEALQNAIKHARPDALSVRLTCEAGELVLEVCDNGRGFDPLAAYPGHLGLQSMRERAASAGGTLDIVSAPDCGTQIRVNIPIPEVQSSAQ
jgi:PAS domain S-box-containing protein